MAKLKKTAYKESVGARILAVREQIGLNQKELGTLLGASQNQVSQWEGGLSMPSPELVIKLKKYCDVTLEYVYGAAFSTLPDKLKVPALFKAAWLPETAQPKPTGKKTAA